MSKYSRSKKEWIKERIDAMDSNEHSQIYAIVRKYTAQFTNTQSGVLVSTDSLSDECLVEIEKYVVFCQDQRKRMDEDTKTRKSYERMVHE
jgi:hypothetical protein